MTRVCFRKQKFGFCGFVLKGDQLLPVIRSTQRHLLQTQSAEQNSSSWINT